MQLSNQGLPPGYNFVVPVTGGGSASDNLSGTVSLAGGELLWNVAVGCSGGSPACQDCCARAYWERWSRSTGYYVDEKSWGNVMAYEYAVTVEPARWPQTPQRILVAPAGDLFNEQIPDRFIDRVLLVMQQHPQHSFYLLTKRAERMHAYLAARAKGVLAAENRWDARMRGLRWPLPNVHVGVSCENQKTYMARVRKLIETPAARRFVVAEPMLGPIRLDQVPLETRDILWPLKGLVQAYQGQDAQGRLRWESIEQPLLETPMIDWVVVGGFRGQAVRPMHPQWVRAIRQSCAREGTPFFFKGWGDYAPARVPDLDHDETLVILSSDGTMRGRGAGSATNFLAMHGDGSAPDTYMTRKCDAQARQQLDGRVHADLPSDLPPKRIRLADTSDLARMLHRLSDPKVELSGPLTMRPEVDSQAPSAADLRADSAAERVKEAAAWLKQTLNKPVF